MSLHSRVSLEDFATFEEALDQLRGKATTIDISRCVVRTDRPQAALEATTAFLKDIQLVVK